MCAEAAAGSLERVQGAQWASGNRLCHILRDFGQKDFGFIWEMKYSFVKAGHWFREQRLWFIIYFFVKHRIFSIAFLFFVLLLICGFLSTERLFK